MTVPDAPPVTCAEFERLVAVVYTIVDALRDWESGIIGNNLRESLRQVAVRLNALRDREPEPKEDSDE